MYQWLKQLKQDLFIQLFPSWVKKQFFAGIAQLNWHNIKDKNIENELLLIQLFLNHQPKGNFIDVGANLGQYMFQAERCIQASQIYAFEPHPQLNKRLHRLFNGCHIVEAALSASEGQAEFKIPFFKSKEIHTRGTLKIEHIETEETNSKRIKVKLDTIDNFVKKQQLEQISVIKIDVEGAEFDVINGSSDCIKKYQPILMIEIEQRHHLTPIQEKIKAIEQLGDYTCVYFNPTTQTLQTDLHNQSIEALQSIENHGKNRLFINNFIFIPNALVANGQLMRWQEMIKG